MPKTFAPMQQFTAKPTETLDALPFKAAAQKAQILVARQFEHHLGALTGALPEAMIYATKGGKGLRGFLVLETARLHGIYPNAAAGAAAAIEALHAYSLIHDDLPCMDDDDLRRGQPIRKGRAWPDRECALA